MNELSCAPDGAGGCVSASAGWMPLAAGAAACDGRQLLTFDGLRVPGRWVDAVGAGGVWLLTDGDGWMWRASADELVPQRFGGSGAVQPAPVVSQSGRWMILQDGSVARRALLGALPTVASSAGLRPRPRRIWSFGDERTVVADDSGLLFDVPSRSGVPLFDQPVVDVAFAMFDRRNFLAVLFNDRLSVFSLPLQGVHDLSDVMRQPAARRGHGLLDGAKQLWSLRAGEFPSRPVQLVSSGRGFALRCEDGGVWLWGSNEFGLAGFGRRNRTTDRPVAFSMTADLLVGARDRLFLASGGVWFALGSLSGSLLAPCPWCVGDGVELRCDRFVAVSDRSAGWLLLDPSPSEDRKLLLVNPAPVCPRPRQLGRVVRGRVELVSRALASDARRLAAFAAPPVELSAAQVDLAVSLSSGSVTWLNAVQVASAL